MNQLEIVKWLVIVVATFSSIVIFATLVVLYSVRNKVRMHRHIRKMVTDADQPSLFPQPVGRAKG